MGLKFKGRAILAAKLEGVALVTRSGFNTLACFYQSILTDSETAVCFDQDNLEIYGKILTDKVICLPKSIGSTSAGAVWNCVAQRRIAPKAMLFSERIDSLSAAGLILAEVWTGKRICTVDHLGNKFLEEIESDDIVQIHENGTVFIQKTCK